MPNLRQDSTFLAPRNLLVVFSLLWLLAAIRMPPLPDEAYYWTWSKDLSFYYFDHPPLTAWVLAASIRLFGDNVFGLRLIALLSIGATIAFSLASTRLLLEHEPLETRRRGDTFALLVLLSAPMFVVGFLPLTPDPIQGAFTAAAVYCTLRSLRDEKAGIWCSLAAFVFTTAIALKHYAAFIAFGAFLGLLREQTGRDRLMNRFTAYGVVAGIFVLSPWIAAELTEESSALWQFRRAIYGRPNRGFVAVPLMFGSLLGTFGPANATAAMMVIFGSKKLPSLRWAAASLLLACLVAVWAGSGEANWPISAFVCLVPLIVHFVLKSRTLDRVFKVASILCLTVNGLLLLHSSLNVIDVSRLNDPTRRGAGFDEVASVAQQMAQTHSASPIITDRYQFASLLRYHVKDQVEVLEWPTPRARKSQFDIWERPKVCPGQTVVWVSPEKKIPNWLIVVDLGLSSGRSMVDRGVERRKSLDHWYVTIGKLKSKILPMSANCGTEALR